MPGIPIVAGSGLLSKAVKIYDNYENIVLANLMDAGAELKAMVTAKHSFHELGVGVWTELIINGKESRRN